MQSEPAIVVTYDSTSENEDILWGFGLGCNSVVQVLIESLSPDSCNPLTILAECWRGSSASQSVRSPSVLANIFHTEGLEGTTVLVLLQFVFDWFTRTPSIEGGSNQQIA